MYVEHLQLSHYTEASIWADATRYPVQLLNGAHGLPQLARLPPLSAARKDCATIHTPSGSHGFLRDFASSPLLWMAA
jgi:hypothetical protein